MIVSFTLGIRDWIQNSKRACSERSTESNDSQLPDMMISSDDGSSDPVEDFEAISNSGILDDFSSDSGIFFDSFDCCEKKYIFNSLN